MSDYLGAFMMAKMSNSGITIEMMAYEILAILSRELWIQEEAMCSFCRTPKQKASSRCSSCGASIGGIPFNAKIRSEGHAPDGSDEIRATKIAFTVSDYDLFLSMDEFSDRILKPITAVAANVIRPIAIVAYERGRELVFIEKDVEMGYGVTCLDRDLGVSISLYDKGSNGEYELKLLYCTAPPVKPKTQVVTYQEGRAD